jgi:hypothetical protein
MAGPIHKMFYLRFTDAWFQLPKEEQDQLLEKVGAALTKVGGKSMILCNSAWMSEKWWYWGVEEFPSIEAIQEHTKLLADLNWMRYCNSETLLGTVDQA